MVLSASRIGQGQGETKSVEKRWQKRSDRKEKGEEKRTERKQKRGER